MNKKITLTNFAGGYGSTMSAWESKTDKRYILDLGSLGFGANEVKFKVLSNGSVEVYGNVKDGNPMYDADGNLDNFGHNKVRKDFKIKFTLNTAKYDMHTLAVDTQNGVTRVQANKYGVTKASPNRNVSGSYQRPVIKARPASRASLSAFDFCGSRGKTVYCTSCPPCFACPQAYYVSAPYSVRTGSAGAYALN